MTPIMLVHILGGGVALLSGAGALALRKGGRWHARAGTAFFASMLVMTATGALIAALKPERGTAAIGLFTFYLVATAWSAARRRDGKPGRIELAAFLWVLGCATALLSFGLLGLADPDGRVDSLPWQVHFVFGSVAMLAALFDLAFLWRGRLDGVQRISRHLWRMCVALLIATSSFFQGQQDEFPEAVRGSTFWYVPALAVLAALIFWGFRVRFGAAWRAWPPRRVSADRAPPPRPAPSGSPGR